MLQLLLLQPVSITAVLPWLTQGGVTPAARLKDARPHSMHRAPIPEEEPIPGEEPEPEDDPVPHPDPVIREPDLPTSAPMSLISRRQGSKRLTGSGK